MQDARLQVKLGAGLFVMHIWMMDVDKAVLKSSVRLATEPLTEGSNLIG
jgi:DNA-binding PucR family transcriptional regulator